MPEVDRPGHEQNTVKFLCDSCKAKYQIADEKVAGKTVRMKCRKCGHQIEVRAAVTETSVASAPPRPPTNTSAPRPPMKSGLATSLSAAKPRAPSAPAGALAGAFKSNLQDAPASVPGDRPSTSIELSVTDEWYVAINGVPVGPVRISELRRKAAGGAVTEESLCWQEGLEEWRPIRSIPELAALVREAAQGNRPSLIGAAPEPPVAPRSPSMPSAPQPAFSAPPRNTPPPPAPRPMAPSVPAAARSNVVPLRPAASSIVDDIPLSPVTPSPATGGAAGAAAFAPSFAPAPPAPMFSAPPAPSPLASPVADPFAVPPAAAAAPAAVAVPFDLAATPSLAPPPPAYVAQKKGVPLWFWPILVLALGFGGGIAFIAFKPQPPPAPVVIQVPAPATTPAPTATEKDDDVPLPTAAAEPTSSSAEPKGKPVAVAAKGAAAKTADVPEKKGLDLGNLVPNGGGPSVGPNSAPGSGSGGGLDQAGVERVVAVHRNGVKRTCWERGGADQKSSVNVTVTANVAPNGSVSSTSSSGDDPVVAKCIENQVKSWQFPAPGASTTINIPFKFVRQ
ncbi:MAG: zinc-ribbon domain-containing protein [Labilithrix sp.]|nr:zinc-ribbon domain-containing protein [Labilithrix sp.]